MPNTDFSKEFTVKEVRQATIPGRAPEVIYNFPITPKENMRLFLTGKKPVWLPNSKDLFIFAPKMIKDNTAFGIVSDAQGLTEAERGGPDIFGVEWIAMKPRGSMVKPGAPKVPDITCWEDYISFPNLDELDWEGSAEINRQLITTEKVVCMKMLTGYFERLISLMDFENAAVAMIDEDEQEAIHRFFTKLAAFYDDLIGRYKKYYDIDMIEFHDDWGSQRAPFFGLDTVMEMVVPYLKHTVETAHKLGIFFKLHSCGMDEPLVPAMIEAGVDIWGGQRMNDKAKLYGLYGSKIALGVPPRYMLADDHAAGLSDEQIIEAAEEYMENFGKKPNIFCIIAPDFGVTPAQQELMQKIIYEQSREFFANQAY